MDACINFILSIVKDTAPKATKCVFKLRATVRALRKDISQLKLTEGEVKVLIREATVATDEVKQTDRVGNWLEEVAAVEDKAEVIELDYNQRIKLVGGCLLNFWSGYRIGRRALKMSKEVKELDAKGKNFDVVTERMIPVVEWRPTMQEAPEFEAYMEMVHGFLRENMEGVVGVWGMGGVGKTFLIDKIQTHQFTAEAGYEYVIRVAISREPDVGKIQEVILKRLNLNLEDQDTVSRRAYRIQRFLEGKCFLLLLDDLWSPLDLQSLGIPIRSGSSTESNLKQHVVFTTRSEKVCLTIGTSIKFQVQCLQWKDAWQLFQKNLNEVALLVNSNKMIETCAMRVAKKCGGLPLALKTVGQAMSSKRTLREWQDAEYMLERLQLLDMWGKADDPFPLLQLTYDYLPDDRTRQCFLSCALWPEGYPVTKDEMILSWMGQGFLDGFDDFNQAYNKGHTVIEDFKQLCLLETPVVGEICLKMHHVIRDLALWIASDHGASRNKWFVRAGLGLEDAPVARIWSVAEKISLMQNKIEELPQRLCCPNLITLILRDNPKLCIPAAFVENMPKLRYLDAAFVSMEELSVYFCRLTSLLYLDLSSTNIRSLPKELQLISGLEYLILENTLELENIPDGLLTSLEQLRFLNLTGSLYLQHKGAAYTLMSELDHSRGHKTVAATAYTIEDFDVLNGSSKVSLWKLSIELRHDSFLRLKPTVATHRCLQELDIARCSELKALAIFSEYGKGKNALENLEVLVLADLPKFVMIEWSSPPSVLFCNLRSLRIHNCASLREISWIQHLQQLEDLSVACCQEMKEVIISKTGVTLTEHGSEVTLEEDATTFRNLKNLLLFDVPNLEFFCRGTLDFPCLQVFLIDCPKLKKLPFSSQIQSNKFVNIEIHGNKEWWDGLGVGGRCYEVLLYEFP